MRVRPRNCGVAFAARPGPRLITMLDSGARKDAATAKVSFSVR